MNPFQIMKPAVFLNHNVTWPKNWKEYCNVFFLIGLDSGLYSWKECLSL